MTDETAGMKYAITDQEVADLQARFTYHPPKPDQPNRYADIRTTALMFALGICQNVPPSRERSLALTKLEEVTFWANAAIARNE